MENKTGKYFKYAIGEIILVVVGILIALQISNWNEEKKERKIEIDYVISLIEDLKIDTSKLSVLVKTYEKKEFEIDTVLTMYRKLGKSYNDTLWRNLPAVIQFPDFIYTDRTMQQLKNSGAMHFITNKRALNGIIEYDLSVRHLMESYIPDLNFYYQNSNLMWFEIFDIEDYEADMKKMSVGDIEKGNKNYLLRSDKATLGKFNNIIRNFKEDVTLVKDTETELKEKAEQLILLLEKEYIIR
jgi:hypothetical protein